MSKSYIELLKDPRWQKKRLVVQERDGWRCVECGDDKTTLHVHHLGYGKKPWDVPDEWLITLCEVCHALVTSLFNDGRQLLQTMSIEELRVAVAFMRSRRLLAGCHPPFPITFVSEADGVGAAIALPGRTVAAACKGGATVGVELLQRLKTEAGVRSGGD